MKKTVKAGVLTGLILAPAAVVSANGTDTMNTPVQAEPTIVSAVPYNTVASLGIEEKRIIQDLFELNEEVNISNFQTYKDIVNRFFPEETFKAENDLLMAKLNFLEELQKLKPRATSLTNEIGLLKTTHPQLFTTVPKLVAERADIVQSFGQIRTKLDNVVSGIDAENPDNPPIPPKYTSNGDAEYDFITDFELQALKTMDDYSESIKGFESKFLKNAKTLDTYAQDIIKAEEFISGEVELKIPDGSTVIVQGYVAEIAKSDTSNPTKFKQLVEDATKYYNEKMTANEKKIADSHVLEGYDQTVAAIMKQANADLAGANKVAKLITDIESVSGTEYKTAVKKAVSEYGKLNVRAQTLVLEYEKKVANKDNKSGYKDGLDFIELVDALKPNASPEYRTALEAAEKAYDALNLDPPNLLASYDAKLAIYREDVTAAVAVEIKITELGKKTGLTADDIKAARTAYDGLTPNQKKIVNNYKELQSWEKSGKTMITLSDQIDAVVIENKKTFATKVDTLNKSFNKLSSKEQSLVKSSSSSRLKYLIPFANVVGKYEAFKTTSNSSGEDVLLLKEALDALDTPGTELNTALNGANATDKPILANLIKELSGLLTKPAEVVKKIQDAQAETDEPAQLKAIQDARTAYNNLPKEEQKLVTNLKTLTDLENAIKQPLAVIKAIEVADPENISKFPSTAKSAVTAFEKLTGTQREYLSGDYQKRIEDFKTYLAFVDQVKALKPSAAGFQEAYTAADKEYKRLIVASEWKYEALADKMVAAVKTYESTLKGHKASLDGGQGVQKMIEGLSGKYGQGFLTELDKIDAAYAALSSDAKKQVTNYKQFQQMKKDGVTALKVVDLINNDAIYNVNVADSNYVKKVESAIKAFDKLTPSQKAHVYNAGYLERNLPIYEIVAAINNLKPSAKTYIEDVAAVRQMYNRLTPVDQRYLEPILYKIEGAETGLVTVNEVMDLIDAARPGVENYVQKLTEAREAYDKLARINSGYQKLVLNYKTLTEREKALKPVTTAIYQIKELEEILARPVNDSNELVKKYNNAVKAYEKIPYESRELVYNRDVLLSTLYPVAKTMEAIANIKPTSNTFAEDVKKARNWYDSLSDADKARVSNYRDLVAYENTVSGGAVVDELIRQIPSTSPTQYMQAIKEARAAYDALTANEKRAVTLYKELQNYEKGVKNVQAAIDAIDNLQYASNLVSAYDKATKALDKLTTEQRQMVPNMDKLRSVGPAIDVYKMIDSLKPSSANYAGTIQAAYAAYNMLSSAEKQYVTNFAELQEAKNNIDSVQAVISKIASISPTSRNYTEQVAEALAMYNSLPSAVRKLVTNYDVLKSSQKEADTVDKVRQLISEINPNASNFEAKLKLARAAYDKLTTQQKRLVSNYYLLEDYESQTNNNGFFF